MTAAEIKKRMSKGVWEHVGEGEIEAQNNWIAACKKLPLLNRHEPNALAITTAVNNTYGAGIDPATVKEMHERLTEILMYLSRGQSIDPNCALQYQIQDLLNAAKITITCAQ